MRRTSIFDLATTAVAFTCIVGHLVAPAAAAAVVASTSTSTSTSASAFIHSKPDDRTVSATLFAELEELARLVDIAYCVGYAGVNPPFSCLSHCSEFEGFELITTWNTGPLLSDSCGYIALSHPPFEKRIIVAFRGTYSLANTIVDLSAVPQVYVPYPADGEDGDDGSNNGTSGEPPSSSPPADERKCNNCTVHAGFLTSWENTRSLVLSSVAEARAKYPDYEIVLVGHSLGGAVAALAGLEMQLRGWKPVVTTFGEPRIGNAGLAEFVNALFDLDAEGESQDSDAMRYRRVTHVNDPIPLLPLEEWGYVMHAGEIYISKLNLPPSIADLELCDGDADERCIAAAAAEDPESIPGLSQITWPSLRDPSGPQKPLQNSDPNSNLESESDEVNARWSLVPARYRLWELFFAHRDYFWRIGLCVPGGDPGSWRLSKKDSSLGVAK